MLWTQRGLHGGGGIYEILLHKATWSHVYNIAGILMERQFTEVSLKTNELINAVRFF